MDILDELTEGTKRIKMKLAKKVPTPLRKPAAPVNPVVDRSIGAFLGAMAQKSAEENARPNKAYSLVPPDPTAAIGTGSTATASFTLPDDAYLVYWAAVDADATNFLLTSLKVGGYDVVGGSPINLASFLANVNRCDRPGPLTGRVFQSGTTVEATVRNIQSTPQIFHGLTVWCISTDCQSTQKGRPAPSVLSFASMARSLKGLGSRIRK
ncbi:hypothetical protein [Polyangium sp. y55x31]|uniref:hypothetical protein n=1 Tax=Polyangium sp. y55x31 TaxID=3042688 RepID=UPI002482D261|nr:hypothetical protein [Polyangium sp. y55x31]MDI1475379.1 hypothetical protein [Polyangium sp. y55x31]